MDRDHITVRVALDVTVSVGFLGEDTVSEVFYAVESMTGELIEWLTGSEMGRHGARMFDDAYKLERPKNPYTPGDARFEQVDFAPGRDAVMVVRVNDVVRVP